MHHAVSALLILLAALAPAAAQNVTLSDSWSQRFAHEVSGAERLDSPEYHDDRYPGTVRVVAEDDLARSGAKTIQDALRLQPGVVLFDDIGNSYQQTLDLRGFNAQPLPATVVLVDGARVNEADFGEVNWHLIPLQDVARIEVLPGPQTLFGRNALAGVINIVTKSGAARPRAWAQAAFGSFDAQRYAAGASGPVAEVAGGALRYRLSASRDTEHGWRSNSAARIHLFSGRLDWADASGDARGSLTYRWGDDYLRQPGSLTSSEISRDPSQNVSRVETDGLLNMVTLEGRHRLADGLSLAANGDARRRLSNTPLNQGRTSISRARALTTSASGVAQLEHSATVLGRRHLLALGFEGSFAKSDSDPSGAFGAFPFLSGSIVRDRAVGLFAQETFDLLPRTLVLTAGLRHDLDSLARDDKQTPANDGSQRFERSSPRLGLDFNPTDELTAFASLADAFRTPTADEISALGPFSQPLLRPVKTRSVELGVRAHDGWGEAQASVYRSVTHDDIFPVFDPTAGFGQNRNLDKTRRQGVELEARPRWGAFEALLAYSYTEAAFQTEFKLDKAPFPATQLVHAGSALPLAPRHRLALGLTARPGAGVTVSADEVCVSAQSLLGDESNTEPRLGGYCLLGLSASLERGPLRWFARVDNALDRAYVTRGILGTSPATGGAERFLVPAAGIAVRGGVEARWGGGR